MKRQPKLLVFAGAGISVDSGLPTFRRTVEDDASTTFWGDASIYDVCSYAAWEQAKIAPNDGYVRRIENFYAKMWDDIRKAEPNSFHHLIAEVIRKNLYDVQVVTTNVDDLFEKAGIPESRVLHLHGSILHRRCMICGSVYIFQPHSEDVDQCPDPTCLSKMVKTDVTFYGEACTEYAKGIEAFNALEKDDYILMAGSSGETFTDAMVLWSECRRRDVRTIHINPHYYPHIIYFADVNLRCGIRDTIPFLRKTLKIDSI